MKSLSASALFLVIGFAICGAAAGAPAKPNPDALWVAAEKGDVATVKKFLDGGGSPNAADSNKLTLLNWAAYGGQLDLVKLLVARHADVNVQASKMGYTPLMNAAAPGFPLVAAYLLDHGANLNLLDAEGNSALAFAAAKNRTDVVRLLLDRGADGGNALVQMVHLEKTDGLKLVLESGVDANATPRKEEKWFRPGETALYRAAWNDKLELATILLDKGANPNISTPAGGNMSTPLLIAAYRCSGPMIDALIAHGASLTLTNASGETAHTLAETGWTSDMKPCAADILAKLGG